MSLHSLGYLISSSIIDITPRFVFQVTLLCIELCDCFVIGRKRKLNFRNHVTSGTLKVRVYHVVYEKSSHVRAFRVA